MFLSRSSRRNLPAVAAGRLIRHFAAFNTLAGARLQWTLRGSSYYNPLRRDVAVRRRSANSACAKSARQRREHIVFRRILVGPVEAVSLAKPSKPADEEKFALFNRAGISHLASAALAQAALPLPTGSTQVPVASAANAETEQFPPGNRLLMQAAAQLDRHASVSAKLRHQVAIAGSSSSASAATGNRAAARSSRCGWSCKSPGKRPRCCRFATAASRGSTGVCRLAAASSASTCVNCGPIRRSSPRI